MDDDDDDNISNCIGHKYTLVPSTHEPHVQLPFNLRLCRLKDTKLALNENPYVLVKSYHLKSLNRPLLWREGNNLRVFKPGIVIHRHFFTNWNKLPRNNENLLKYYDVFEQSDVHNGIDYGFTYHVFEYHKNGSSMTPRIDQNGVCTFQTFDGREKFTEVEALKLLKGTCKGLKHVHTVLKWAHNDIKPQNILISEKMVAVVGDLDLCNTRPTEAHTPGFVSPEILKGEAPIDLEAAQAQDMWALGMVFCLWLGLPTPVRYSRQVSELEKRILECKGGNYQLESENCRKIVVGLLNPDPKERWKISDLEAALNCVC